ncbi:MAG: patatin-like phospholipase family protein [Paracoccaceae bacterium]
MLSSGGEQGVYAHTGFLMALQKMGVNVAAVSGCSAGALVGGIYASGTDLNDWAAALGTIRNRDFWQPDPLWRIMWNFGVRRGRGYAGISDTRAGEDYIRRHLKAQTFEDCRIPFYALATNITRSRSTLFSAGDLAPRIMASAAIPLFYRPISIDGELYSDGAVIQMTSTEAICCKHNLDVLVIQYTAIRQQGPRGLDAAMRSKWTIVEVIQRLLHRSRPWYLADPPGKVLMCPGGCGTPIIVVEPELPQIEGKLSQDGPRVQQAAMQQALETLAAHRGLLLGD